jgi:hypothetical protein
MDLDGRLLAGRWLGVLMSLLILLHQGIDHLARRGELAAVQRFFYRVC